MDAGQIATAIRHSLKERGLTPFRAAMNARLPENAIRTVLAGHEPKVGRLAEICDALGLEFYVGPPRDARPQGIDPADVSASALQDLETGARALNRVVAEAGGDPVPDDLWPVLAARRGPGAAALADNDNLAPGARPVDVVELAAAAGSGAEALGEEIAGCVWFRQDWLASRGLDPAQCAVIRVIGESMEPLLNEGDSILVDRQRRDRAEDRIYVVRTGDGLVVKRAGRGKRRRLAAGQRAPVLGAGPLAGAMRRPSARRCGRRGRWCDGAARVLRKA